MEINGDAEVVARAAGVERLLLVVCDEEEFPWFVSDHATIRDVCSLDDDEILARVRTTFEVSLGRAELTLPIWKIVDKLEGLRRSS